MIRLKDGCSVRGLRPEAWHALYTAEQVAKGLLNMSGEVLVTSATDGDHSLGRDAPSFHYNGLAVDLRTKHLIPSTKALWVSNIRAALATTPKCYDVVFEDEGGPNEHLHIEFDDGREVPKRKAERIA